MNRKELDKQLEDVEKRLEVLFTEKDCKHIYYYAVAYTKTQDISCIFETDADPLTLTEWMRNAHSSAKTAYAYYFTSSIYSQRAIYEITDTDYYKLLKNEKILSEYDHNTFLNDFNIKVFDIYTHHMIFQTGYCDSVSSFSIKDIPEKNKHKLNGN